MAVVDVRGRDERMEQRLDRRARLIRHKPAAAEVVDHLGIGHLLALTQRQDVLEAERGEARPSDRRQVGSGALHPERPDLAACVVDARAFRRGIPAANVRERAIGSEQIGAIDELIQRRETRGRIPVPAVLGWSNAAEDLCSCAHAWTSFGSVRSAKRSAASSHAVEEDGSQMFGSKEARTTSRASSSDPSSPSAIAWVTRLPTAVASTGPARTGSPAASAVQRQRGTLSAPPPTTWISGGREPVTSASTRTVWACFSARLSRMQRVISPAPAGSGWPLSAQNAWTRAGRSPGARNRGSFGSMNDCSGGAASAAAVSSWNVHVRPSAAQALRHSCSSQRPSTFLSSRVVPPTPPSFVRFAAKLASVISGSASSTPTSDQLPALM